MRDPDTIEREIADERAGLERSIKALDDRLSPEALVDRAVEAVRRPGSRAGTVAAENPLALALIGTGVAWLFAETSSSPVKSPAPGPSHAAYDPSVKPTSPGLANETPPMAGFDARVAAADQAIRQSDTQGDSPMSMSHTNHTDLESAPSGRRERLRQSAEDLRARMNDGLDQLPDAARSRILSARLAAMEAQAAVEAQIARTTGAVRRTSTENPLLIGAVAFGIGAALAAAMPRTSVENRSLGARRDQLMDEADRMFREEAGKLRAVAEAAVEEGKSAVKDTLRSGPPTEDNPAERVGSAAKREADRQEVGNVN